MNQKNKKIPARFEPEVRFAVVTFRAAETSALERLKDRLLRRWLDRMTAPEQNVLLRRAADDAAALAWTTCHPLLFFPALLEEKARAALLQFERQARIRRRGLDLALEAV